MTLTSGLFGRISQNRACSLSSQAEKQLTFIEVGGKEDNIFYAVAAALLSNLLANPRKNQLLFAKLIERYQRYFNRLEKNIPLLTLAQRLERMFIQPGFLSQFVANKAYILRQIAVDELCKHPHYYVDFFSKTPVMSIADMREPGTVLPQAVMTTLADELSIFIIIHTTEPGKELPLSCQYGLKKAFADEVVIQCRNGYYLPGIIQPERFKAYSPAIHQKALLTISDKAKNPAEAAAFKKIINLEEQRLIDCYFQNVTRLTMMLSTGEVDKNALLNTYIKGIQYFSPQNSKKPGIEHSSQQFFDYILFKNKAVAQITAASLDYDTQLANELIKGLSRAISLKQVEESFVFNQIESFNNDMKSKKPRR